MKKIVSVGLLLVCFFVGVSTYAEDISQNSKTAFDIVLKKPILSGYSPGESQLNKEETRKTYTEKKASSTLTKTKKLPKTGETLNCYKWQGLLLTLISVLFVIYVKKRKKEAV